MTSRDPRSGRLLPRQLRDRRARQLFADGCLARWEHLDAPQLFQFRLGIALERGIDCQIGADAYSAWVRGWWSTSRTLAAMTREEYLERLRIEGGLAWRRSGVTEAWNPHTTGKRGRPTIEAAAWREGLRAERARFLEAGR